MRLLFVQGGSRIKINSKNELFVDGNFNNSVFNDYYKLADEVTFLLRKDAKNYENEFLELQFTKLDSKFNFELLPDFYRNIKARLNLIEIKKAEKKISQLVKKHDKVIIRSVGNFYTNTVLKYAKKYDKPYLIEVTGFAFEGLWYHSIKGKILAIPREIHLKKCLKNAPYAVYVTNEALQKRYPCKNITLGCSDVRLVKTDNDVLENRIKKINKNNGKIILGTSAFLDVKWKGQRFVIYALAKLKKQGYNNFEYHVIGAGTGNRLRSLAKKLGVEDRVKIIGSLPHNEVFNWLDSIDIYIQSSFQEGLCRSIVEAMSRACPVICSDVGGNYELVDDEFLFKKADTKELINCLLKMDKSNAKKQAEINFYRSLNYEDQKLKIKRDEFYKNFIRN